MSDKKVDPAILAELIPIKALSPEHCKELATHSRIGKLNAGEFLYKSSDKTKWAVYILKGVVELLQKGVAPRTVTGMTKQARLPLEQRLCSARAQTDVVFLRVDAELLDNMLALDQSGRIEVQALKSDEDWMSITLQAHIFHKIPPMNIQSVFMRMQPVRRKAGQLVFKQGDVGDAFYVVSQGRCQVVRKNKAASKAVVLANLSVGSFFGEESLISDSQRNASVVMVSDGVLMRLKKNDFVELLKDPVLKSVHYNETISDPNLVWLDVMLPSEYKSRHLKNSMNLPFPLLRSKLNKLDRNRRYVVYCETEKLSSTATFLLNQNNIDAILLDGGLANVPNEGFSVA